MAGDPSNASLWANADVYVGPVDAPDPTSAEDEFGADWDLVGLLNGDAGFTLSREEEMNDLYAWGGVLVRTSRRNFKQTVEFTVLEDNDTTRDLIWPGSTSEKYVVPRPERIKIAFEVREGGKVHRLISAYQAEVDVTGDINMNEANLTEYELTATIFPDTTEDPAVLFNVQEGDVGSGS